MKEQQPASVAAEIRAIAEALRSGAGAPPGGVAERLESAAKAVEELAGESARVGERVTGVLDVLLDMARQDFSRRATVDDRGDAIDALASGVNMLAEELQYASDTTTRLTGLVEQRTVILRSVLDSMDDGVAVVDNQGRVLFRNPASERLIGPAAGLAEWRSRNQLYRLNGEALRPEETPVDRALRGEPTDNLEVLLPGQDGREGRYLSLSGRPVRLGRSGSAAVVLFRDMTAARASQQALRESEARFRALFEGSPVAMVERDVSGIRTALFTLRAGGVSDFAAYGDQNPGSVEAILESVRTIRANRAACKLFGCADTEELAQWMTAVVPAALPATFGQMATAMLKDERQERETDATIHTATGEVRHVLAKWSLVDPERGVGLLSMVDVTERVQMETALRRAVEAAEAASLAKSEFLANMSHEIRTPMNGIIGMTGLLLGTTLGSDQREYLRMVQSSADTLLHLINDILDFSKIEAGRLEPDPAPFELRDFLADLMKAQGVRAGDKRLELVLEVAPDVPDALTADFARLGQVLVNLVGNAIKFTAQGEVVVRVALESLQEAVALLRFSVTDTGIGIAPDKHRAIFDAFTQADPSTTREFGGTGLGLSISSRLVSMLGGGGGGAISLESAPGAGSTFSFTLSATVQAEALPSRLGSVPPSVRHLEVLVVDDNATSRLVLQQMLRGWEMRPKLCVDAADALAKLDEAEKESRAFGLALIDAQMPGMDGFALAARLRSHRALAGEVILMLSSGPGFGHAARAREAGIARTLTKPVKQSELFDIILGVLGEAAVASPEPRAPAPAPARRLRVLLAEDNAINQALVRRLLEQQGHEVVSALNGREAASLCAAGRFDVVLMDVQMPIMDGLQGTAAIRQLEAEGGGQVPIVGVTAHAMKGDRERCLAVGMDGYVTKPVRPEALFAAIEQAMGERGARAAGPTPPPAAKVSTAAAGPDAAVLDEASLVAFVAGDGALLGELADLFAQDTPVRLAELREALSREDRGALERAAHSLKGSAGSLFGRSAAEAAELLETIAGEGGPAQLQLALDRVAGEAARLGEALAQLAAESITRARARPGASRPKAR